MTDRSLEADPKTLQPDKYLALIDRMGKGRFAQRLLPRISDLGPLDYIKGAIEFVAERV